MIYAWEEEEWFGNKFMESFATTILDATYHKVDIDKVINDQKHLPEQQKRNCTKCLLNSLSCSMERLVFIHKERSTKIC